ncbi:MAG: Co2+/Mg2+ efflux protein ApaG [Ignavibacteria bacterium]|nr:Co2+/Mg2+ efflux protein ApaG [Ignavibacteria bacterium]
MRFTETTEKITVTVRPVYLDGQSNFIRKKLVFAYFVRIENNGYEPVKLLRRHWIITDGNGKVTEVEGEGVIGLQPVISPGHAHEYSSFSIIETMEGTMRGAYLMQRSGGEQFWARIPQFSLRAAAN